MRRNCQRYNDVEGIPQNELIQLQQSRDMEDPFPGKALLSNSRVQQNFKILQKLTNFSEIYPAMNKLTRSCMQISFIYSCSFDVKDCY
jgi:hypothetical protein